MPPAHVSQPKARTATIGRLVTTWIEENWIARFRFSRETAISSILRIARFLALTFFFVLATAARIGCSSALLPIAPSCDRSCSSETPSVALREGNASS